jgi:hypothetical protein
MEMQQTHCYATGTVTLLWKCYRMHRSCYQGKPNMSQYFISMLNLSIILYYIYCIYNFLFTWTFLSCISVSLLTSYNINYRIHRSPCFPGMYPHVKQGFIVFNWILPCCFLMSAAKLNNRKCVSAITGSMISHAVLCELYVHDANMCVCVCVCMYLITGNVFHSTKQKMDGGHRSNVFYLVRHISKKVTKTHLKDVTFGPLQAQMKDW